MILLFEDGKFYIIDNFDEDVEEVYLENEEIEEDEDDGHEELGERLKRKWVVRGGKKKRVKKSTKKGFKVVGGKETKMKGKEKRARRKAQRRASKLRRAKKSSANRKRARSMRKRKAAGIE